MVNDNEINLQIDGEHTTTLDAFLRVNEDLDEERVEELRAMKPGELRVLGGGACAEMKVRRLDEERTLATPEDVREVLEHVNDEALRRGLRFGGFDTRRRSALLWGGTCCQLGAVARVRLGFVEVAPADREEDEAIKAVAGALRITEGSAKSIAYGFLHPDDAAAAHLTRNPWIRLGADMRAAVDARAAYARS